MSIFKIIPILIELARNVNKAMEDRVVTVQEAVDIANDVLLNSTGKALKDIGIRIAKTDNKTKIEMVF